MFLKLGAECGGAGGEGWEQESSLSDLSFSATESAMDVQDRNTLDL